MPDKLLIKGEVLSAALATVRTATDDFKSARDESRFAAEACGHGGLAKALNDAASSWDVGRGKLIDTLEWLGGAIEQSITTFGDVDDRLAEGLVSGAGQTSSTRTTQPSESTQSNQATLSSTPAPDQPEAPVSGPSGAGPASVSAPGPEPSGTPGGSGGGAVAAAPGPDGSGPPVTQTTVPTTVSGGRQAVSGPDVAEANVVQLFSALWQRWTAMGGSQEALLAAMTGLGLVGLLGKIATGGGHRPPRPHGATVPGEADQLPGPAGHRASGTGETPYPDAETVAPLPGGEPSGSTPERAAGPPGPDEMPAEPHDEVAVPLVPPAANSTGTAADATPEDWVALSSGGGPAAPADLPVAHMPPLDENVPVPGGGANSEVGPMPSLSGPAGEPVADAVAATPLPGLAEDRDARVGMAPGMALGGLAAGTAVGRQASPSVAGHGGPPELSVLRESSAEDVGGSLRTDVDRDARRILEDLRQGERGE